MRNIHEFEVIDHGIEWSDYFQGCGVCGTQFDDVATGIGANYAEAIDDCLESLAQSGWETEGMERRIIAQEFPGKRSLPKRPNVNKRKADNYDCYYHVSIRVKMPG